MTIELVIFDLGPQLLQGGAFLAASIDAAFSWNDLGDGEDAALSTAGAVERLRGLREVRGTSAAFSALRSAGIRTAIATGCPRSTVAGVLTRMGWNRLVDIVVSAEDTAGCRSSTPLIGAAMKRCTLTDVDAIRPE